MRMAKKLISDGYQIVFIAPRDEYSSRLADIGEFEEIRLDRRSTNPVREILTLARIFHILRSQGDCIVLSWTPKANIYGGITCRVLSKRFIPNIAGLGYAFSESGLLPKFVKILYGQSLRGARTVFFQNSEDRRSLISAGVVLAGNSKLLPGSGVDLKRFCPRQMPARPPFVFLFGGRLIVQKGIRDLVEATKSIKGRGYEITVNVVGFIDDGSPTSISRNEIESWHEQNIIRFLGSTDEIESEISKAHCVVHPSYYREGRPRILLESAASGRPAITTDSIGCRDVVRHGETGLLCEPRNPVSLAHAMEEMIRMAPAEFESMGRAARNCAETEFSEEIVISEYRRALRAP